MDFKETQTTSFYFFFNLFFNMSSEKYLVSSALPYVNNVPHLGTLLPILSADAYARHLRLKNKEVLFICGTDEHGSTTEVKAREENLTPKEITDKYYKIHKDIYEWFNCSFDSFGRTSSQENKKLTQEIFLKLYKNKYILEKESTQLFCKKCNTFLSDRFIEGICPKCKYEKARGDQCENCGNVLNPTDLIQPKCKFCSEKPEERKTKHLYIDLENLQPKIEEFFKTQSKKGIWTENAIQQTESFLKEGLKPRPITRDLKWGIPVPLETYKQKVFYVWFDAPIGYISITDEKEDYKKWWLSSETNLTQFMGKDNIVFHSILFPASLIGTKDNWKLVDNLVVNEFLNYEDGKFSKSQGTGIFGDSAIETGIPADVWRYYLFANRPETNDSFFTWQEFKERLNNELVANLGNLINRTLTFIYSNTDAKITEERDKSIDNEILNLEKEILSLQDEIKLKSAIQKVFLLSKLGNKYFQDSEPWVLIKTNPEEAQEKLNTLANLIIDISILVSPFLPHTAKEIQSFFSLKNLTYKDLGLKQKNLVIKKPSLLFQKIEDEKIQELKEKFSGKKIPFDIRTAKILEAKNHPEAEKLLILKVKLYGEKKERQIVAGLKQFYPPEYFLNKKILVLANLKPANLRGELSQGMLLAADGSPPLLIEPEQEGEIEFEGTKKETKEIDYKEFQKHIIQIKNNEVYADGKKFLLNKKPIKSNAKNNTKVF